MNAWVFRHLDELQRIYREPSRRRASLAPAQEGPGPFASAPAAAPSLGPDSGSAVGEGSVPGPGSVLWEDTDDGPDLVLMPQRQARRLRR